MGTQLSVLLNNGFKKDWLGQKDKLKAESCNKFIGYGVFGSSTARYAIAAEHLGNCGQYDSTDRVFVSINGTRRGAIHIGYPALMVELNLAAEANVVFVADRPGTGSGCRDSLHNRDGEGKLARWLMSIGYREAYADGVWARY